MSMDFMFCDITKILRDLCAFECKMKERLFISHLHKFNIDSLCQEEKSENYRN